MLNAPGFHFLLISSRIRDIRTRISSSALLRLVSSLLSNLYMRRFVLGWKNLGHEKRLQAYIINYADDLVICSRARADEALVAMRNMMSRLKLTVNESKTRVCRLPEERFDFLGYSVLQKHTDKEFSMN